MLETKARRFCLADSGPDAGPNTALGIERTRSIIIVFTLDHVPQSPKCAKLGLGASAVHVRSLLLLRSRFLGVGSEYNEKSVYCELG